MAFALFGYVLVAVGFYVGLIRTAEVREERVLVLVDGGCRSDSEEYRRAA